MEKGKRFIQYSSLLSLLSANRSSCSRTDTTSRAPSSAVPPPPTKQASTSQVGREGRGEREAKHLLSLSLSLSPSNASKTGGRDPPPCLPPRISAHPPSPLSYYVGTCYRPSICPPSPHSHFPTNYSVEKPKALMFFIRVPNLKH